MNGYCSCSKCTWHPHYERDGACNGVYVGCIKPPPRNSLAIADSRHLADRVGVICLLTSDQRSSLLVDGVNARCTDGNYAECQNFTPEPQ